MRVEVLAERAGVSVDTVRYYQAKGLISPPRRHGRVAWYDEAHLTRIERIRSLQSKGFSLATIDKVLSDDFDAADAALVRAVAERFAHEGDLELDLEGLSQRTGIPVPLLKAVENEGLLRPHSVTGHSGYTEEDVAAAKAGLTLLEWGVPLSELLELAREHNEATQKVARRAVEMFDQHVRKPARDRDGTTGNDEEAATKRLLDAFAAILPATTTLVSYHFTRVLLEQAIEHIEAVGSHEEVRAVQTARSSAEADG